MVCCGLFGGGARNDLADRVDIDGLRDDLVEALAVLFVREKAFDICGDGDENRPLPAFILGPEV